MTRAVLILEDGSLFEGESLGTPIPGHGEVVFNTSMTGYQEVLTDPSYSGQLVVLTYPIIGNYGINLRDNESERIQVAGLIVRESCDYPSHELSNSSLGEFLASQNIPAIKNVDTRAITRAIRRSGVMMGYIHHLSDEETVERSYRSTDTELLSPENIYSELAENILAKLEHLPKYDQIDFVKRVTTKNAYHWTREPNIAGMNKKIVVLDLGLKYNILRNLEARGCEVLAVPANTSPDDIWGLKPDGIVLSPGPGDPAVLQNIITSVGKLLGRVPILGICLGHQILARAMGGKTFKLKFGHRGANHPVKDLNTGAVSITAQNHGYAVDGESLPDGLTISHINLNDGTVEGLCNPDSRILTIQYHCEASPGPKDNEEIFDRFLAMMDV